MVPKKGAKGAPKWDQKRAKKSHRRRVKNVVSTFPILPQRTDFCDGLVGRQLWPWENVCDGPAEIWLTGFGKRRRLLLKNRSEGARRGPHFGTKWDPQKGAKLDPKMPPEGDVAMAQVAHYPRRPSVAFAFLLSKCRRRGITARPSLARAVVVRLCPPAFSVLSAYWRGKKRRRRGDPRERAREERPYIVPEYTIATGDHREKEAGRSATGK